jgi:TRAP-type C4-dicarboxylate transport system permease small subunit
MRKLLDRANRFLDVLLVLSLACLVVPVSLQILSRQTSLIPTFFWTEEIAVLLLSWTVMIGATIAVREALHFDIDLWPNLLPRANAALAILANSLMLIFAIVFIVYGLKFAWLGRQQILVMTGAPRWFIYAAWPLSGALWTLFLLEKIWDAISVFRTDRGEVATYDLTRAELSPLAALSPVERSIREPSGTGSRDNG